MTAHRIHLAFVAALAVLGAGCAASYTEANAARDEILETYFTPEAAEVLKAVPLRVGPLTETVEGLAVGDDLGSRLAGVYFGYPWEKQVIVTPPLSDDTILHEYVHQADYAGFISRSEFAAAVIGPEASEADKEYARNVRTLIRITYGDGLLGTIALWYDDGLNREWLAWLAQNYALDESLEWPAHLIPVYERALQFPTAPAVDEEDS
ncbi:MAG: hypothetical protein KF886_16000 [Candidatus Hydrogenedentes bacterium]|nr:hypothetical protein [Candidatus Hydrogenedentota bacterium]